MTDLNDAFGKARTGRVLKWNVPVDDRQHLIGSGPVLLVACQYDAFTVTVWTEEKETGQPGREVRVYGTGQPLVEAGDHLGSVLATPDLVWHVYESASH